MPNILSRIHLSSLCQRFLLASGLVGGGALLAAAGLAMRAPESVLEEFTLAPRNEATQPENVAEMVGWYARYRPAKAGAEREIKAQSPFAAFALEPGLSVHPAVPADGFEAIYTCDVKLESAGKYRFGAELEGGTLQIAVVGGKLTEPVTLKFGPTPAAGRYTNWLELPAGTVTLQYSFTRSGDARTRMRAMWEKQGFGSAGFRAEPIPVTSARVPEKASEFVSAAHSVDRGRVLLSELGCVHCHALGEKPHVHDGKIMLDPLAPVPHRAAPSLDAVGTRASPEWITRWITDPTSIKKHAAMPAMFSGPDASKSAESLTHFLVSIAPAYTTESVATEPAGLALAQKTYQTLGCVACHGAKPGTEAAAIPLTGLAGKWNPSELAAFLLDPRKARPSGRMPSLNLTKQEADLLATHLVSSWGEPKTPTAPFVVDPQKAKMGRIMFSMKCASCHVVSDGAGGVISSPTKAKTLNELAGGGCLDPKGTGKAPRYDLTDGDRAALVAAIAELKKWTVKGGELAAAPMDRAHLTIDALSCRNCHEVHGEGGLAPEIDKFFTTLGEADLGEEGRVPPRLNGTGTKLTTSWMHEVFERAGRARPYMGARMPQFGEEHVGQFPESLAMIEGVWPSTDKLEPQTSDEMVQGGRKLAGINGLNCISCHVVGNNAPAGSPGPDITMFASRLRYEWWVDYVHAPSRYKPGTKMPSFYENGVGAVSDVFGGDSVKQADALWAYFNLGEFMPAPEGLTKSDGYVIKVGTRPVVMRMFMKDAGSRGIAVGYPESLGSIHFAFDAEQVRLSDAWQGAFLNASGAWAGRGGNTAGGQGSIVWTAPPGPALVFGAEPKQWPTLTGRDGGYRFRGYRLDEKGVPTFDYEATLTGKIAVQISERFEPTADKRIKRTFTVTGLPDGQRIWLRQGKSATENASILNVAEVRTSGANDDTLLGVTPKTAGQPVSFSVTSKP